MKLEEGERERERGEKKIGRSRENEHGLKDCRGLRAIQNPFRFLLVFVPGLR